ncbi:ArsC/Spx/MgsR family protein [Tessaracoccus sp. MC1756]|uniref:ArsC/Spx/MgsR family protein n=1 Tax=Tessaracoccus sp. MC1756 TaxID=2760311 RepID=UPI0016014C4F|nr:ArsC/Spx/MgsR family protein [Tessaracoccus sp. MC1756]MBB1510315.1 arsenate reductase [Tessaracoccus sp. MC1756]
MSELTILHNPRCSTSRAALEAAEASPFALTVRNYVKVPLTEEEWLDVIAKLDAHPTDLVRRDANFNRSTLSDDDVRTAQQVAKVLAAHPEMAQRPVLIRGDRAIIGRPKAAVAPFLAG